MNPRVIVAFQKLPDGASDFGFTVNGSVTRDITLNSAAEITWELDGVSSLPGIDWATGQGQQGIVFTPSWTNAGNAQPTLNATTNMYQVNDNGPFDQVRTFHYMVSIRTPGTQIHVTDPDVTNTPPP